MRETERRTDTAPIRIQESIYTPGRTYKTSESKGHFPVLCQIPCNFEAATRASMLGPHYCGGSPPSVLLDGAAAFLSFLGELLSPLKTPTILPRRLFFLIASSPDWTPALASGFPLLVGGGSGFTEFPPNMREKNPCTP